MISSPSLLKAFDLPDTICWENIGAGHMNQTWIGSIAGNDRYVLHQHHRTDDLEDVLIEHQLLHSIHNSHSDLVNTPITSIDGETVHAIAGKLYSVFPFHPDPVMAESDPDQIIPAAQTLALIHDNLYTIREEFEVISATRPSWSAETFSSSQSYIELWQVLQSPSQALEPLQQQGFNSQFLQNCYIQAIETLQSNQLDELIRCPIHGDYGSTNLLWNPDIKKVTRVLNWDECRWDSPLFDLASASQMFCENSSIQDLSGDFIPAYMAALKRLNPELHSHINSYLEQLPALRQVIWLFELQLVLKETPLPSDEIEMICQLLRFE